VDTSLKFAYAWATFGYVVPSAALAALVDADDLGASLAVVQLTCESAKAVATVRVLDEIDRGVGSLRARDDGVFARGAAFGAVAVVVARVVDGFVSRTSTIDIVTSDDAPASLIANAGPLAVSCAAVAACFVAPALEELFFRGFLCEDIRRRTSNTALAIGLSSIVFALAHFSLPDVPSLFACGVIFSFASQSRGGVRSAFVAHALFNASVLIERAAFARGVDV
jgi:membrane protease YdiL (CAAX protease family)